MASRIELYTSWMLVEFERSWSGREKNVPYWLNIKLITFSSNVLRSSSLSNINKPENKEQLFLPEEKVILEKLLPSKQIKQLEKKFIQIDNEKSQMKQKYLILYIKNLFLPITR